MNDVMESIAASATVLQGHVVPATRLSRPAAHVPFAQASRRRRESWSSSLNDADLECLLQVLESNLIPQLVRSYSPARDLPFDHRRPSE